MKLSISRDLNDLTPEQPTVDENIANANKQLKEYADSLDREELPMWLTNIIISIFLIISITNCIFLGKNSTKYVTDVCIFFLIAIAEQIITSHIKQ